MTAVITISGSNDNKGAMTMRDYDFGDFDGAMDDSVAGPLIGGGAAQVGQLAAKLLFAGKEPARWAGAIGAGVGGLVGVALLAMGRKNLGLSALITALLIGVPRQLEDMLAPGGALSGIGYDGSWGVITPAELAAWGAEAEADAAYNGFDGVHVPEVLDGFGEPPVQLLDSPLRLLGDDDQMGADLPVSIQGGGGFGVVAQTEINGSDFGAANWG